MKRYEKYLIEKFPEYLSDLLIMLKFEMGKNFNKKGKIGWCDNKKCIYVKTNQGDQANVYQNKENITVEINGNKSKFNYKDLSKIKNEIIQRLNIKI